MTKKIFHWIPIKEYKKAQKSKGHEGKTACGIKIESGMGFSTEGNIPSGYVNCDECKEKYEEFKMSRIQKMCSFCSTLLRDEDYENSNDFYLSCFQHKRLAKIETEKFFKENPNYTKWNKK